MATKEERYLGCLLGLAVGDALGTTLEFESPGSFDPITDMAGGGPFNLQPGEWTDDTSMALCLAHSLLYQNGFDPIDQMNRYCNWWQHGYMSSNGRCFDIGSTVATALKKYLETRTPFCGSTDPHSAGNGSLMRLAPVVMFYSSKLDSVIRFSGESSRTTHGCEECIDACRYFGCLIYQALQGDDKETILGNALYTPSTEKMRTIASGNYHNKAASEIRGSGYVVESLEAALWCFATTESYDDAVLKAANLGDDADTTAAIVGQIAGAYYGVTRIREKWLSKLVMHDEISDLALSLLDASHSQEQ